MDSATDIPVQVKRPKRIISWLKLTSAAGVLVGVLVLAGFLYFSSLVNGDTPADVRSADAIVVLTGGADRIPEAVKLLSLGKGQRLLISGVNPITKKKELASLSPNNKHWFRCCVDVGHLARDTIGNAEETRAWVEERGFNSLIVVTASYHMPRSLAELRRALPDTDLIAYPVQPSSLRVDAWWKHRGTLELMAWEYAKFVPAFSRCVLIQIGLRRGLYDGTRQCLNVSASS